VALRISSIKNVKFKMIKITCCQYVGYVTTVKTLTRLLAALELDISCIRLLQNIFV